MKPDLDHTGHARHAPFVPIYAAVNEFQLVIASATAGAPATEPPITPGNNAYGAYVQLLAGSAVTDDAYGIWLVFNNVAVSGAARDCLAKVGVDPAGGTTYTDLITDLLASCAGAFSGAGLGGVAYYFPLRIAAGTSIAVALSVNNATVGTGNALCKLMCRPSRPELLRTGSFVRTFGSSPASSSGTPVTPNSTGGKSAFVQLGAPLAESLWYWTLGVGCNNAAMSNNQATWDLAIGDATNRRIVLADQLVMPTTAEVLAYTSAGAAAVAAPGDRVWARAGANAASPTGMSAAAYGVGG